jgi:LysM repeat protein
VRRVLLLLPLLLVTAATDAVMAEPAAVLYRVKRGDTLEILAAEYYGDRRHAVLVAAENGIDPVRQPFAEPLRPNTRLRIPVNRQITTDVGDSLASLASVHLGDERRAKFLAGFNEERRLELPADAPLAAGQVLEIPIHVRHRVKPQETLASLAASYFGAERKADLIREYNFLDTETVAPGTLLVIPILRIKVQPTRLAEPDDAARARAERHREMQANALSAMAASRMAWRDGDYTAVKDALSALELDYLFTADVVEIGVLLGSAWVALDEPEKASAVFRAVLARAPAHVLDPHQVSPKIRAVWEQARTAAEPSE